MELILIQDGGEIQEEVGERAADHLPALLPPPGYLLRHHSLQAFLFRGRGNCEPHRDAGDHDSIHQVGYHRLITRSLSVF